MSRKRGLHDYWNANVCDTREHLIVRGTTKNRLCSPEFTRAYFDEIARKRVASPCFAESGKYQGKKILEVGIGSGVDFVRWVQSGADATGIDLTEAAVEHTTKWLTMLDLIERAPRPKLQVMDAENLGFDGNTFDMVWSWGVLHHTPDTVRAIGECVRVAKAGGEIKLMLYNRDSLLWLLARTAKLATGKDIESPGTKAFSRKWAWGLGDLFPVTVKGVTCPICAVDRLSRYGRAAERVTKILTRPDNGFFMMIRLEKA
jgi:ubiquinone/menaquinone biosynthesis C-methylase UbiE